VSSRRENEARGAEPGRPSYGPSGWGEPAAKRAPAEERARGGPAGRPWLSPLVFGLLVLAVVGVFLWFWYGDRAGGTSVFEDSVDSGPEPVIRVTNGPGRVGVKGVEGLETVEITAKRYARGFGPTSARENATRVPVEIDRDGSILEISSNGGRGTGADYDLQVPAASIVEIESEIGDVEVSGLSNNVTVRAEGGDVAVEDVRGSIKIEAPQGDVTAETVSTDTGRVEITVGLGDLELEDLVVGILEAQVEAGDVTLSGRFSGGGRVFVETGSIDDRLPPEDTKDLDLEARVGEVVRDER
jgi:hypothetical protein